MMILNIQNDLRSNEIRYQPLLCFILNDGYCRITNNTTTFFSIPLFRIQTIVQIQVLIDDQDGGGSAHRRINLSVKR